MQDKQPAVVFKYKNVGRVGLGAAHFFAGSAGDVFETGNPGSGALNFDGDFRNVDAHERRVAENLVPTGANVFPAGEAIPIRMDAKGAGIRRPDFIHEIDVEAFQGKIELEIRLNYLLGISHK